jgi:hypothetical protein
MSVVFASPCSPFWLMLVLLYFELAGVYLSGCVEVVTKSVAFVGVFT